jgi:ankyrin repeat protein
MTNRKNTITTLLVLLAVLIAGGCAPSFTPEFRRAIVNGNIPMAKSYLREHPEWVNAKDEDGRTPLHEAVAPSGNSIRYIEPSQEEVDGEVKSVIALRPQPESAKLLIEEGANVNAKDKRGETPLHEATKFGRLELAELIIKNGANVNVRNRDGETSLYYSTAYTYLENDPENRYEKIAKLLVDNGADVRKACKKGSSHLLWSAVAIGRLDIAQMLIKEGVEINVKKPTQADGTPLGSACMQGHREIAELMIVKGANVNIRDSYKMTILHYVAMRGHTSTAQLLIDHGAEVNARAKQVPDSTLLRKGYIYGEGATALHIAAARGHKDLTALLIDQGADVNAKTEYGNAPLHLAVWTGHLDVVQLLITVGADVNCKNREGTPLDIAVDRKNIKIAELLRKHGAVE